MTALIAYPFQQGSPAVSKVCQSQVMCRTFWSKKFVLKVRHHFHTLEHFIITDHFSAEKMYDEFPFVRWHLLSLERHEPRDSGLFER